MCNSDRSRITAIWWCAAVASVWLTACSTSPRATETPAPAPAQTTGARPTPPVQTAVPPCALAAESTFTPQARDAVNTFQRTLEAGPLFAVFTGKAPVASCRIGFDAGTASLEYQFQDGGWFRAKRDPSIEYSDYEAHLGAPPAEDPVAILTRAERAAFGDAGCGIDWKESESRPAADMPGVTDTIFRGDSCNCQARVRKDGGGRVVGLSLRSAC
jgi:hypothetical protein